MAWRRLSPLVVLVAAVSLAGCGGRSPTKTPSTTDTAFSVLRSRPQRVTFAEVDGAIARLYRQRPGIREFVIRDVEYSRATRDKVLEICHRGGLELNRAALESSRIAGCAPLIFFFYNYGREKSAPDAVAVAVKIYWYAVESLHGPFDAQETLDALLHAWGVA